MVFLHLNNTGDGFVDTIAKVASPCDEATYHISGNCDTRHGNLIEIGNLNNEEVSATITDSGCKITALGEKTRPKNCLLWLHGIDRFECFPGDNLAEDVNKIDVLMFESSPVPEHEGYCNIHALIILHENASFIIRGLKTSTWYTWDAESETILCESIAERAEKFGIPDIITEHKIDKQFI